MEKSQERILFLYEFKLGHIAAEATRNINSAFEADTVSERTARRWFEKFRSGDVNLQSESHGHPGPSIDNEELRMLAEFDTRQSVGNIAEKLGVHNLIASRYLQQLGKVEKLDSTEKNMALRMEICSSLHSRNRSRHFLHRIVACDESPGGLTWVTAV